MSDRRRSLRLISLLATAALLSACGGEDGGTDGLGTGTVGTPANPIQPLSVLTQGFVESFAPFEDAAARLRASALYAVQDLEFLLDSDGDGRRDPRETVVNAFPLASARIEYAHAAGLTGAGSTVAILDSGFLRTHESFADRVLPGGANNRFDDDHGTAVASVLAGRSAVMTGVAPGASLVLGSYGSDALNAALMRRAAAEGAVAVNNSWGYPSLGADRSGFASFQQTYPSYLQSLRDYSRTGVTVFAVSNEESPGGSTLMEALPLFVPELEPGWLAVVNGDAEFDASRILSASLMSAPCGSAARWCLAAEGTWLAADGLGRTSYSETHGTSFAAPMVSGALALLEQAFPNLTPHQLRVRLLASADNSFQGFDPAGTVELAEGFHHSYSTVWGHGFLDVRAALLPIGTPSARMADGSIRSLDQPLAVTGGAVGDAVARSLSSRRVLATDALGGDFRVAADALVVQTAPAPASERLAAALRPGAAQGVVLSEYGGANLSLHAGDTEISVLLPDAGDGAADAGLSVGRSIPMGAGSLYLGLNVTQDDGRLLPVGPDGATARLAAVEIGYSEEAGRAFWSLGGGIARAGGADMGPLAPSSLTLNSLRAEFGQRDVFAKGDRLTLGLAMPMAVVSGMAEVALPQGRAAGGIVYDPVAVDFAPESREVNLSLVYDRAIGEGAELVLGAIHSFNHGHVAGRSDSAAMLGFRLTF